MEFKDSTGETILVGDKVRSLSRNNVISGSGGYEWTLVFREGVYWAEDRFGHLNNLPLDQQFWEKHLVVSKG